MLRAIERRLEGFFEGLFGRAFKSYVQPVELARKLAKEMDDRRSTSLQRTFAPNEFTVYLSPEDRERFASFEPALRDELSAYLAEHASRERLELLAPPRVHLETDHDLPVGTFGIAAELVAPPEEEPQRPPAPPVAAPRAQAPVATPPPALQKRPPAAPTAVYGDAREGATVVAGQSEPAVRNAVLAIETGDDAGRRYEVTTRRVLIGRSRDCDLVLPDSNVSRQHAEVRRRQDGTWALVDLGSTNGTEVNGRRATEHELHDGDRATLGTTTLRFELPG